jgi:exopolysaccharide biosynthesis polyprenyl glycosylphosphotransferase
VIGSGEVAALLAYRLGHHHALGYELVGAVSEESAPPPEGLRVLGRIDEVDRVARDEDIDLYLVALPLEAQHKLLDCLVRCEQVDVDFEFVPDLLQLMTRRARVTDLEGFPLISLKEFPLTGWNAVLKRTMDVALATVALPVLAPVFLAIAAAIRLDSPGPVFYRQSRMGRDGRVFPMLKFRSMRLDAESESGPVWTREDDPRRTRLGAWLRATSLDELPQIWNVFRGEMSLVGPRPERPYFVEQFTGRVPNYFDRHRVKSGMTGWAQVNGLRGDTPIEERTRYDLFYIENWSLFLDIRILFLTVRAVAAGRQRGAY